MWRRGGEDGEDVKGVEKAEVEEEGVGDVEEGGRGTAGPLSLMTLRRWISTIAYMSVLMMAPHVHHQYGHVRPWRKSLGGVSLSPRGIRRIYRFAGKRTGNVSPPFRQR